MSRIVLLGLSDGDVDVLSHIPGMKPRPQVIVAHPDPTALVLQLASLSDLPTTTSPPAPRSDDVVVVSDEAGPECAAWIDAFRQVGARVVSPGAFRGNAGAAGNEGNGAPAGTGASPPKPPEPDGETDAEADAEADTEPDTPSTVVERIMTHSEDRKPRPGRRPELSIVREQGMPPAEIWSDPETTFRYLVAQAVGPETPATLWWDGGIGIWVPWVWTGPSPVSEGKSVAKLPSAFAGFRLTGDWTEGADLPLAAMTRVAEDMALRDLALWQKTAESLSGMAVPRGRDALRQWAAPVLKALAPETAWLWERQPDGWKLRDVLGGNTAFSGDLRVSEQMMEALYGGPGLRWERWRPAEHLSVQLGFAPVDGQWPLRWERVKKALAARQ
jgi:hypothetical protein